jgi:hypothetical protein
MQVKQGFSHQCAVYHVLFQQGTFEAESALLQSGPMGSFLRLRLVAETSLSAQHNCQVDTFCTYRQRVGSSESQVIGSVDGGGGGHVFP